MHTQRLLHDRLTSFYEHNTFVKTPPPAASRSLAQHDQYKYDVFILQRNRMKPSVYGIYLMPVPVLMKKNETRQRRGRETRHTRGSSTNLRQTSPRQLFDKPSDVFLLQIFDEPVYKRTAISGTPTVNTIIPVQDTSMCRRWQDTQSGVKYVMPFA